jgi:hypothetical protein
MDEELIRSFIYAVDGAHIDACAVFGANASFGNDVGHAEPRMVLRFKGVEAKIVACVSSSTEPSTT